MKLSRIIGKSSLLIKRKSPEILLASGIMLAGLSVYFAIKETFKASPIVNESKKNIEKIHEDMNNQYLITNEEYSVEQGKNDLKKEYCKTGKKLIKIYLPCIICFTSSIASVLWSHKIVKGRELAAVAAYTSIRNAYTEYRGRVKKHLGNAAEREIYLDKHTEETKEISVDSNGNQKEIVKKREVYGKAPNGDYTYLFDECNINYEDDVTSNIDYLLHVQAICNNKLYTRGYLFLYEVYNELGIDINTLNEMEIKRSHYVGWIYSTNDKTRDNFVDFGLCRDRLNNLTESAMHNIRSNDPRIWLEFNVDGDILSGNNGKLSFAKVAKTLKEY